MLTNNYGTQWRTQKVSEGGPNFRHNRVTSQINLESAEGTTIIGSSRACLGKMLQNYTQKYAFSYWSNRKLLENQKSVRVCFEIQAEPQILAENQLCFY